MPELPEVETVVRTLAPKLTGRRITRRAIFLASRGAPEIPGICASAFATKSVQSVERHGKFIVLTLDQACW